MKIGIIGCAGRMGKTLLEEVLNTQQATLAGGIEYSSHPAIGKDIGELIGREKMGIAVMDNMATFLPKCDAVIDFSSPKSTMYTAQLAARNKKIHIIGTTGLSQEELNGLATLAKETVIMRAANMSIAVNLMFSLVEKVSAVLDPSYDIEIVEMHHKHKVDAPSGTALTLGEYAAFGRKVALQDVAVRSRDGITGARKQGDIGFATLRGGDVVGDHTVIFATEGERLEITHKASDRSIFAKGAVRACLWAKDKQPGKLYNMQDVLHG